MKQRRPKLICGMLLSIASPGQWQSPEWHDASAEWPGVAAQDNSLLQMPPWGNPWLLVAMALSFGLHFVILYVPVLAGIFSIVPLSLNEWLLVIMFAFPVILIDEALKFVGRTFVHPPNQPAALEAKKRQ